MPLLTDHEDKSRYTAPPDTDFEESRYNTAAILAYVESWIPGYTADSYTLEEVREILAAAADKIKNEHSGIDTI